MGPEARKFPIESSVQDICLKMKKRASQKWKTHSIGLKQRGIKKLKLAKVMYFDSSLQVTEVEFGRSRR